MKIAIISDTHAVKNIDNLEAFLEKHIVSYDLVIHCGDYISPKSLNILGEKTVFYGVWGNADDDDIKSTLKEKIIIDAQGKKIGVFHGHGEGKTTLDRAYGAFANENVDIIAFGHSHQPIIRTLKGILMLNPGSSTNKRREPWFSYISLEIKESAIIPSLILFG